MSTELTLDDLSNAPLDPQALMTGWDMLFDDNSEHLSVYRIPERDNKGTGKTALVDGERIRFSRFVVRVGYEIGVHSVTKREWFEAGARIVAADVGISVEDVKRIICALGLPSPFKYLRHRIYERLIRPLIPNTRPENQNIRALWFHDCEERTGTIVGTVAKLTGRRLPGGQSGPYGEDYDPPVLSATGRQVLYKVRDSSDRVFTLYDDVLVYPEDAVPAR